MCLDFDSRIGVSKGCLRLLCEPLRPPRLCVWRFLAVLLALSFCAQAPAQPFVHPGGLHTLADLNRMKTNVLAGNHPWIDDWNQLVNDPEAQSNYTDHATADMGSNRQNADADAHAAYLNTIRWYISGDTNFANEAVKICNDWSAAVNQVPSNTGLVGLPIMSFGLAGELLRAYSGWQPADFASYTNMMLTYLYPACTNYIWSQPCSFAHWTSWDGPNNAAILAMGVLCDDSNLFNEAVNRYESGIGTAAISNAIPILSGSIGQPEESGRDQEHCTLGIADLGVLCQVAWNQGVDLYGFANNRLLAGIEYLAQYNLSHNVPYTAFNDCANDNLWYVSDNGHGRIDDRPVYEMFYNHYVVLQGLSAPGVAAIARLYRPEHGSADHFGYGTLTYTLNAAASPYLASPLPAAPTGLVATPGVSQITLNWTPPPGDLAGGYRVLRSTTSGGPYATIASWTANTTPSYTDTTVVNGMTYFYIVSAWNQSGASATSAEISAASSASALPAGWTQQDVGVVTNAGSAQYTAAGNNTFYITGAGTGIGGTGDGGFSYTYRIVTNDFTIIARLTALNADQMGLMMRGSLATNAAEVQFFMANNARQSIFAYRNGDGANLNHYNSGDQFTYPPAWYKLARSGNNFTAYQSGDGVTWTTVQTATVSAIPGSGYYVGLAINSGNATFDNVVYTNAAATGTFAPPSAPANLTAAALAGNLISLSWNPVTNASGYNVLRAIASGGPYTNIVTDTPLTGAYDPTVAANTAYYYIVTAINGGGQSANSSIATATTPSAAVPVAPASLAATPGAAKVVLSWPASVGAASYNVKRSMTTGGPYTNLATGVVASFADTNVITGLRYYYVVTAVNNVGESGISPEAAALVLATMQTYLKFDETGGTVAFDSTGNNWNGSLVNGPTFVAGYSNNAVNLSGNSSQYVTLPTGVVSGLTNFTIAAWVKQTTAASWMRIFDFGSGTATYMFLTPLPGGAVAPRFAFRLNNGTEQQINGTSAVSVGAWHHFAVTLNGSVGILYVDGVAVGTNSSLTLNPASLGSTTQNYIGKSQWADPYFNGLVDEFRIYDDALSAGEVATFITPLTAPANLVASAGDGAVSLKWNAVARAAGYNLFRSLTNGGPYSLVTSVATTNITDTGLANGTNYYYVVTAINATGSSPNSFQASARTVSLSPPQLASSLNQGQLQLMWPADHTGWQLQAQTNPLAAGLGTNWTTISGSASTNQISLPTSATNGSVFYRLIY